jgi:hypothetical protein
MERLLDGGQQHESKRNCQEEVVRKSPKQNDDRAFLLFILAQRRLIACPF